MKNAKFHEKGLSDLEDKKKKKKKAVRKQADLSFISPRFINDFDMNVLGQSLS